MKVNRCRLRNRISGSRVDLAITLLLLVVLGGCRGKSEPVSSSTPTPRNSTQEGEEVRPGSGPEITGTLPEVRLDVPPRPRVVELRRWSRADAGQTGALSSFYLRLHPAGPMRVPDFGGTGSDTTFMLPREGIEVVAYGQAARTYWYSNGDFVSLTTAD